MLVPSSITLYLIYLKKNHYIYLLIYLSHVCIFSFVCVYVRGQLAVLPLYCVGLRGQTEVIRFVGKHFHIMNHLALFFLSLSLFTEPGI